MLVTFVFLFILFSYVQSKLSVNIDGIDIPFESEAKATPPFNPKADLDYCSIICNDEEHVACKCHKDDDLECHPFRPDLMAKFRLSAVKWHNRLRQHLASGDEKSPNGGEAADMNAISYDLGLEYVAMCTSIKCYMKHDRCRHTKRFAQTGQNIYMINNNKPVITDMDYLVYRSVEMWYEEISIVPRPDVIDKFEAGHWGHYTAMSWATITHLGCSPCAKLIYTPKKNFTYIVTCNYGTKGGFDSVNAIDWPVYKRGKAASSCRDGRKPNKIFPALCGDIEPIPIAKPVHRDNIGSHDPSFCTREKPSTCFTFIIITLGLLTF